MDGWATQTPCGRGLLRAMRRLLPPLPQATLGAPLRRLDARTPKLPRTRRGLGTRAPALTGGGNQCVDLGWAGWFLYAMRRRFCGAPPSCAWGSIAAPGRAHDQINAHMARIGHARTNAYGRSGINALTSGWATFVLFALRRRVCGMDGTATP